MYLIFNIDGFYGSDFIAKEKRENERERESEREYGSDLVWMVHNRFCGNLKLEKKCLSWTYLIGGAN